MLLEAERILVMAPSGRDGPLVAQVLSRAGLEAAAVTTFEELLDGMAGGAGALFLAEESLKSSSLERLVAVLEQQPPWSVLPVVVMTGGGKATRSSTAIANALEGCATVTLLERPLRTLTLVTAMQAALRARRHQYAIKRHLEDAEKSIRQRDQFLAMLGHELRNPLAPLRSSIQALKHYPLDERSTREMLDIMDRQVRQMVKLVDDLLEVSRVTRGTVRLEKRPVDLRDVVTEALETTRPLVESHGHTITTAFQPESLVVQGDFIRLVQVLTNLINNAAKYTPDGGAITINGHAEDRQAVLRVSDNGVGMQAELLPRVFEIFQQGERSLARSEGGLGIGLTLVKSLIEMHGGSVRVASPGLNLGSVVEIRMPLDACGAPAARDQEQRPEAPARRNRILVVDDNRDAADSLAMLLRARGHNVSVAYDGKAALELAAALQPEIVLLDIGLPGSDGYNVARWLRSREETRGARLYAVTGYGQEEDRLRAHEAGFDGHFVKPLEPSALDFL